MASLYCNHIYSPESIILSVLYVCRLSIQIQSNCSPEIETFWPSFPPFLRINLQTKCL